MVTVSYLVQFCTLSQKATYTLLQIAAAISLQNATKIRHKILQVFSQDKTILLAKCGS